MMVCRLIDSQSNLQVGECQSWLHLEVFGMAASRSFDKNGQLVTSLKIEFDAHGFDEEFGEHGFDFLGH